MNIENRPGYVRVTDALFALYVPIEPQPSSHEIGCRLIATEEPVPEPSEGFQGSPDEIMRQRHEVCTRWRIVDGSGCTVSDLGSCPIDLLEPVIEDGMSWHVAQGNGVELRDGKWCWFAVYATQPARGILK